MPFSALAPILRIHLFVLAAPALAAMAESPVPLFDVGNRALAAKYQVSDCVASIVASDGAPALSVTFGARASYPNIRFEPGRVGFPSDWTGRGTLAIALFNPGEKPVEVGLRIDSRAATDRGRQAKAEIPPRKGARLLMPLDGGGAIVGMIGQPPKATARPGDIALEAGTTPFDPKGIKSLQLFVGKPKARQTLILQRIELGEAAAGPRVPFVDRFGQFNGADWPGKLKSEADLVARRDVEREALAKMSPLADRDAFGGWAAGPKLEASGHFRVQRHGGKWWFVDPEGRLFWSSGITGVRFNNATRVAGREKFFEWLPPEGDPLARFFGGRGAGRTFDFYAANLVRRYGADFESAFFDVATRRLVAWGVNTIANWSDERSWALRRVPYTVPVNAGGPTFVVTERLKAGKPWVRTFPDPFDPRFVAGLDAKLSAFAHIKDDPWLLGVFIDNELPWTEGAPPRGVGAAALDLPPTAAVKAALLKGLRSSHSSPDAINAAFGTRFSSWDDASGPWKLEAPQLKSGESALAALDAMIAEQYFRTCRDAVRRHLPGALYLGCRFHVYNREAIRAAKKYCDVVSFNIYAYSPSEKLADEFAAEMDFPVVIGEFHFGATDRGMFHPGLRKTDDQVDRASKYGAYLTEAASAPWCVGAHWFQYLDQPLTGRGDGENYNIGFVNATDDAYPELSGAARKFHAALYTTRAKEARDVKP